MSVVKLLSLKTILWSLQTSTRTEASLKNRPHNLNFTPLCFLDVKVLEQCLQDFKVRLTLKPYSTKSFNSLLIFFSKFQLKLFFTQERCAFLCSQITDPILTLVVLTDAMLFSMGKLTAAKNVYLEK